MYILAQLFYFETRFFSLAILNTTRYYYGNVLGQNSKVNPEGVHGFTIVFDRSFYINNYYIYYVSHNTYM